jgi:hypothetical protein
VNMNLLQRLRRETTQAEESPSRSDLVAELARLREEASVAVAKAQESLPSVEAARNRAKEATQEAEAELLRVRSHVSQTRMTFNHRREALEKALRESAPPEVDAFWAWLAEERRGLEKIDPGKVDSKTLAQLINHAQQQVQHIKLLDEGDALRSIEELMEGIEATKHPEEASA